MQGPAVWVSSDRGATTSPIGIILTSISCLCGLQETTKWDALFCVVTGNIYIVCLEVLILESISSLSYKVRF